MAVVDPGSDRRDALLALVTLAAWQEKYGQGETTEELPLWDY